MAWTITELEAALNTPAEQRTGTQADTISTAARMLLQFLQAQRQRLSAVTPATLAPPGSANALANAALDVINLVLNNKDFVPGGSVTFSVMDLQQALFAYRGMDRPDGDVIPSRPRELV